MDVPPSGNVEGEVTGIVIEPNVSNSQTAGTAVWVTKFGAVQYRSEDVLPRVNQIHKRKIPLRHTSDAHFLFLAQFFPLVCV